MSRYLIASSRLKRGFFRLRGSASSVGLSISTVPVSDSFRLGMGAGQAAMRGLFRPAGQMARGHGQHPQHLDLRIARQAQLMAVALDRMGAVCPQGARNWP